MLEHKNCCFIHFSLLEDAIQAHNNSFGKRIRGQEVRIGWGKVRINHTPSRRSQTCVCPALISSLHLSVSLFLRSVSTSCVTALVLLFFHFDPWPKLNLSQPDVGARDRMDGGGGGFRTDRHQPCKNLWIGNLSDEVTDAVLRRYASLCAYALRRDCYDIKLTRRTGSSLRMATLKMCAS